MWTNRFYENFTNAIEDRKLPIGELLVRQRAALHDHESALEAQHAASNPLARFIGHISASFCELRYGYYQEIILQHPDQVHIMLGEFGSTTAEIEEALGIEEQD